MERDWKEQETTPTKKQKLERLVVDKVDELIFTGSTTMSTHSAFVQLIKDYDNKCRVYKYDNLTKYKISINETDKLLYVLSAQYGWQICDQTSNVNFLQIKWNYQELIRQRNCLR